MEPSAEALVVIHLAGGLKELLPLANLGLSLGFLQLCGPHERSLIQYVGADHVLHSAGYLRALV